MPHLGVWMGKRYLPYDPDQCLILAPNINNWLPEDHLARFISNVVDDLDLSELLTYYEKEFRGAPPYDPKMMVKVRIYADTVGKPSSRVIQKSMIEDLGFRFLGAGNFPDHRTIGDFRKIHHETLANFFQQVLALCKQANLVKVGTVAIDGTKVKANASIDKNYSLETLSKKEDEKLKEIARKIIEDGIKIDEEEDRIFGPDNDGYSMPKDALKRIREAKKQLEEKKKKELDEYERKLKERSEKEKETSKKIRGRKPKYPEDKDQTKLNVKKKTPRANTTDPDSRKMKTRRGFIQGYNPQIVVDVDTQIILATDLTQDHNDRRQLTPMLEQTIKNTGQIPKCATADAGYDNDDQISQFKDIDMYIPTQKDWKQRKAMREQTPPRGRIPNNLSQRERRERKLLTKKGKKKYKKRGSSVEPVIGQIKFGRGLGRLLMRGKKKGNSEWKMYCNGHNLLKLWKKTMKTAGC
jgi:transposase